MADPIPTVVEPVPQQEEEKEHVSFAQHADAFLHQLRLFLQLACAGLPPGASPAASAPVGAQEGTVGPRGEAGAEDDKTAKRGKGKGRAGGARANAAAPTLESTFNQLASILDQYQDQSYLLDPYLEQIVTPVADALRLHLRAWYRAQLPGPTSSAAAADSAAATVPDGLQWLGKLMYLCTKVRGHKTITHFFPHQVDDLLPVLTLLEAHNNSEQASAAGGGEELLVWQLRYTLVLWLSLVCMIPFDLHKFDVVAVKSRDTASSDSFTEDSSTVQRLIAFAKRCLSSPGKDRDASVLVLGKLFQRRDTFAELESYLAWCHAQLAPQVEEEDGASGMAFQATGIVFSLSELLKVLNPERVQRLLPRFQALLDVLEQRTSSGSALGESSAAARNSLLAKGKAKLTGRLALKLLRPPSFNAAARGVRARRLADTLQQGDTAGARGSAADEHQESGASADYDDVPEQVEGHVGVLLDTLSHPDTNVRYSAAKGLARICTRLPPSFVPQVTEAVVSLFPLNVITYPDGTQDYSAVSEYTWQGACLALAELARRGLLAPNQSSSAASTSTSSQHELDEQLAWVQRALFFDPRRGAHSVGANVRDAACYVLWALARANDEKSIQAHAVSLAQSLVCAACTDREVGIRRAASAAFQEAAGRMGLFPDGLSVIQRADFFSVGVRRHCFQRVLPSVAEHETYREPLLKHLCKVSLAHWDADVRQLAAQAVQAIVTKHHGLLEPTIQDLTAASMDQALAHGRLVGLARLAELCREIDPSDSKGFRQAMLQRATAVATSLSETTAGSLIVESACHIIAAAFDGTLASHEAERARCDEVVRAAMSRPEELIHPAAASAFRSLCLDGKTQPYLDGVTSNWTSFTDVEKQAYALALGRLDGIEAAISAQATRFLVSILPKGRLDKSTTVETRRNMCVALGQLASSADCPEGEAERR